MIIRVTLQGPSFIFDEDGKEKAAQSKSVDITGELLTWKINAMNDHHMYLVIVNETEKREEAIFAPGTWNFATVLEDDSDEEDDDVPDYTS